MSDLPSVALTQRFLFLCEHHGSQRLVVKLVAVGRGTGVAGLPESDDWTTWDAGQMRPAVEYLGSTSCGFPEHSGRGKGVSPERENDGCT